MKNVCEDDPNMPDSPLIEISKEIKLTKFVINFIEINNPSQKVT